MNLVEILQFLQENKYVITAKEKFSFTRKFYEDLKKAISVERDQVSPAKSAAMYPLTPKESSLPVKVVADDWPGLFMQFILDAKVPRQLENNKGDLYPANKYNEDAMKVFRKLIESGKVDYNLLVKSTTLYYAGKSRFKKNIGNYISQGDWKTDYLALQQATGSEEQLINHIRTETDGGRDSFYTPG